MDRLAARGRIAATMPLVTGSMVSVTRMVVICNLIVSARKKFFGPGSDFKIDTTKPVQVTTRFITEDNTDSGKLKEVKQLYHQNGQTIEHSMYTVNGNKHDRITTEFCQDWVAEPQDGTNFLEKGGLGSIDTALEKGVVLVMSLWDDHEANMLWLDSTYPKDATTPGSERGTCATSSGVPKDVESKQPDAKVTFNILGDSRS